MLSTKASISASVYSGPKRLLSAMFLARFIADAFFDPISYSRYMNRLISGGRFSPLKSNFSGERNDRRK